MVLVTISCKKETDQIPVTQEPQKLSVNTNSGERTPLFNTCADWRISSFKKRLSDETSEFEMLRLTFCPDNTVIMHNDFLAINGEWYSFFIRGNQQYLILNFNFETPEDEIVSNPYWTMLNGIWYIKLIESRKLSLNSISGGKSMIIVR
jgi:hypothetical protein